MGQSSMNCGFSIAMFDCRRVLVKFNPYFCWQNPDFVCFNYDFRIFSLTQSRLFSPAFVGPQRWALLQVLLSDPLYLPSGAVPTILPWDPAGFVGELQPKHQEDLWDREDVTHGRVALSLGKKDLDGVSSSVFFSSVQHVQPSEFGDWCSNVFKMMIIFGLFFSCDLILCRFHGD